MNEPVRWVTKAEAAEELEVSLSTLDRKIRTGELEVRRDGRRVYVRMEGEYISDEELLRRAMIREDELVRTVRELERSVSESEERASELERERDDARESEDAAIQSHRELERAYGKERAAHGRTRRWIVRLGVAVVALLVVVGLLAWRLFA
ncbi:MAG: hypothetical protein OXK79_05995 [Chloroflexota bacterium]|nr:hypothetical protein [Chloroflexota bacterium]